MKILTFTAMVVIATVSWAGSVSSKPALRDVDHIREGLISVGIAYEISEVCPNLRARTLRGLAFLNSLRSHARGLGYSNAEIETFVDDRAEQAALEATARERLRAKGAIAGDPQSYCMVGRSEIGAKSDIGRLLR